MFFNNHSFFIWSIIKAVLGCAFLNSSNNRSAVPSDYLMNKGFALLFIAT